MKNISELTDFYYKTLYPTLKELEGDRKKLKQRVITIGTFYFLLVAILFLSFYESMNFDILIFIGIGSIGIGGFIYKFLIKDYTFEFKERIIRPLISAIDSNLAYSASIHVPERLFVTSELFTQTIDRLSGNDFVKGHIDGIKIQFSDIHAEQENKDSKGNSHWSTIFQGLFIVSEFNKKFHGKTIILPDSAQSTFGDLIGGWLQSKNMSRDELVKMDNIEFEEKFVVYSTDQIEARYILTHTLMEKLLLFLNKSEHPIYISFVGDSIHMAIEYNKDLFEPSVFRSLLEYKIAMEYIKTLHLAIGIVQELKLNQKLWSKK